MNSSAADGALRTGPATGGVTVLQGRRAAGLVVTLILGVLSFQLNASMITPALPRIAAELNENISLVSQVSSLFFLAGAIGGVVFSRWSDFIGRRNALVIVLIVLAAGTLLCIFAPNLPILLIGRLLQGASSAAFQLAYIILSESLSAKVFGITLGIITAVNGGVGGVDGYFGGLLAERFGFRSVFVVIFIVVLISLIAVLRVVPKVDRPSSTGRMDWWGAGTLSLGLICVTYFVSSGPSAGWTAPITLLYLLGTIVSFVAFWALEKRRKSPLIAIKHLRSRQVWPVIATTVLTLSGIFAVINFTVVLLSQNTQIGFGLDPATAALLFLAPPALIGLAAAPFAGWIAGKKGWIRILRVGLAISIIALALIAFLPQSQGLVFASIAILGITYNGLVLTTINGLGVLQSPRDAPAALPGLNGAAFGIGASLGIGIVAPFAASGTIAGITAALWISVAITVLALVTSFFIAPQKAEVAE